MQNEVYDIWTTLRVDTGGARHRNYFIILKRITTSRKNIWYLVKHWSKTIRICRSKQFQPCFSIFNIKTVILILTPRIVVITRKKWSFPLNVSLLNVNKSAIFGLTLAMLWIKWPFDNYVTLKIVFFQSTQRNKRGNLTHMHYITFHYPIFYLKRAKNKLKKLLRWLILQSFIFARLDFY